MGGAQAAVPVPALVQSRAEQALPKQFIDLGGKPIIMHSLTTFLESGCFDAVYIGMHPDWVEYMGDMLSRAKQDASFSISAETVSTPYADCLPPMGLHIIAGGDDRNATLLNVLDAIESDLGEITTPSTIKGADGINSTSTTAHITDPIIVTHDAARPFVTVEMIKKSIEASHDIGASTVAIPTTDTIAVSDGSTSDTSTKNQSLPDVSLVSHDSYPPVTEIPDRKTLYNIQTPQSFRLSYFRDAYSTLSEAQISSLTDVCGIFIAAKMPVAIVPGDPSNIKITTSFDLKVAESVL